MCVLFINLLHSIRMFQMYLLAYVKYQVFKNSVIGSNRGLRTGIIKIFTCVSTSSKALKISWIKAHPT